MGVGEPMDLSRAGWRYAGERWDGYYFYIDNLGLVHLFLNTNPIDMKGIVLDNNFKPTVRELTVDEVLYQYAAVTMSAYIFDGGDYYQNFQPNPVDNPDEKEFLTSLGARIHLPGGLTFRSNGNAIGPAMETGPKDRTLRWAFERWCLRKDENLPVYLPYDPDYFIAHPEIIRPEFVKLEKAAPIKRY